MGGQLPSVISNMESMLLGRWFSWQEGPPLSFAQHNESHTKTPKVRGSLEQPPRLSTPSPEASDHAKLCFCG